MKIVKNALLSLSWVPRLATPLGVWPGQFARQIAVGIVAVGLVAACHRPVDPLPPGTGSGRPPVDSTGSKPPKDSTGIKPPQDSTGIKPPQDSTGVKPPKDTTATNPNGTVGVYKTTKISWSASDFQEIPYNAAGAPVQYVSQYVTSPGRIQRFIYQFQYGPDGRLDWVNTESGYTLYVYEGNQVVRTEERTKADYLTATRTYQYSATNQLIQVDATLVNNKRQTRNTYQHDARGNLTVDAYAVLNTQSGVYGPEMSFHYENFDNQKNPANLLAVCPYLPNLTFFVNNYRTKTVRSKDGSQISRDTYAYAYNEQGFPTQQVRTGLGGTLTATYAY